MKTQEMPEEVLGMYGEDVRALEIVRELITKESETYTRWSIEYEGRGEFSWMLEGKLKRVKELRFVESVLVRHVSGWGGGDLDVEALIEGGE